MSEGSWRERHGLLIVTCLGLAARLAFVWLEPANRLAGDEHTWVGWAMAPREGLLSRSVGLSAFRSEMVFYPPLYPYFIAVVAKLGGSLGAVKLAQVLVSTLLVPAVGRLGRRLFGATAGLVAALIAALYPELVWYSVHFWSETLFLTLVFWGFEHLLGVDGTASEHRSSQASRALRLVLLAASIPFAVWMVWGHDLEWAAGASYLALSVVATGLAWHLLRSDRASEDRAAASGLIWGLAILTRETLLYFVPLAVVFLLRRGREGRRPAALLVLTTTLVVAPWTYRNVVVTHAFIPVGTSGALNLWQGNTHLSRQEVYARTAAIRGPGHQRVAQYRFHRTAAWDAILARQPSWLLEKLGTEMPAFWEADSLVLIHMLEKRAYGEPEPAVTRAVASIVLTPYLMLLGLCVIGAPRLAWSHGGLLLLAFLVYSNLIHVVSHGFSRYRLPVLPVLFIAAGAVVAHAAERRLMPWTAHRRLLAAALLLATIVTLAPSLRLLWTQPLSQRGGGVSGSSRPSLTSCRPLGGTT